MATTSWAHLSRSHVQVGHVSINRTVTDLCVY
jgi:hypothetical protein